MVDVQKVVWRPSEKDLLRANVSKTAKRLEMTVDELREKSAADPAWFWDEMAKELKFRWSKPYTTVLDESKGIEWATWFSDGRINLAENCVDRHAKDPDRAHQLAIIWEGEDGNVRKWTYSELNRETDRLANLLRTIGVGPGDAVGVLMPMVPETAAALMAVAKVGGLFVPLFSGFGADACEIRLKDANAKVLLTVDGFLRRGKQVLLKPTADEVADRLPSIRRVVVFKRLGAEITWNDARDVDWADATSKQPDEAIAHDTGAEDPWMVIYTSGTTGKPKGSVHVHGGFLVKIAQEVYHQTDLHSGDVLFWFTDMGWIMGPWQVVGGLALGHTVLFYEGSPDFPEPDRLWALVEKHAVTTMGVSPTLIRSLMKHGDEPVTKHDLSSLRILASTGEPWNPEPWMWTFEKVGGSRCPIINISGGTEVGACFLSPLPTTPLKPCTLGHPSLGMSVAVLDDAGNPVPPGTVGELAALRPWPGMTRGLFKAPERYLEAYWSRWPGKWYHGDFASVDKDGYWYLHGRSDDTIKIAGKRVGPAEIESILVDTGKVLEAAAVGIPDETKGETVHAWVILRDEAGASPELEIELKGAVAEALGKPFTPGGIHFVADLPRTRNGKILRRSVKAKALGRDTGDLSSLGNPAALDAIDPVV